MYYHRNQEENMNIQLISFKPNCRYNAEAERIMMQGQKVTVNNISLSTDINGQVCSFQSISSNNLEEAELWDYLKLTDQSTGEILDLRPHTAALSGDFNMAKDALNDGATLSLKMKQGASPLHWAAAKNNYDIVALFVANGAEVDSKDDMGWTPLFLAANCGSEEIVLFLAKNGASLSATINGKEVSIELEQSVDTELLNACESGDFERARKALDSGANPNAVLDDGFTALHLSTKSSSQIVVLLLENSANPNASSKLGYTPLMRAAGLGNADSVEILLSSGADPTMKDCDGKTAYQLFREAFEMELKVTGLNENQKRIKTLLE